MAPKTAMKKPAGTKKPAAPKVKIDRLDDVTDDEPSPYMDRSKKRKFDALWEHIPQAQQSLFNQAPLYLY